jgi:hypothetical protein
VGGPLDEIEARIPQTGPAEHGTDLDPAAWADESWALANRVAYALPEPGRLDLAYRRRGAEIVRDRLAAAAVRLAALLEEALGAPR